MCWNFHGQAAQTDESPPSEAWLFAQALLGKPIPNSCSRAADAQADRELLTWLASISDRHRDELRRLQSAEAEAQHKREQLEWLAQISEEHEHKLRALLREESEAREVRQHYERLVEGLSVQEAQWDPAKHPRGAFPQNRGWWSPTGGTGGTGGGLSSLGGAVPLPTPSERSDGSSGLVKTASNKGRQQDAAGAAPSTPEHPTITRIHVPADHRGTWISGTKGHGTFRYNDAIENQQAGLAGKEVRFENQHIAVGGLPAETYYGGNAGAATVEIPTVTGFDADNLAADAAMGKRLSNPKWQRPKGYVWNHAGSPGSKVMELVKEGVHEKVAHKGPAAEPRALRRSAGARRATGRAMGALTVYLTARDALHAAGVLQPDYEVAERETYHYVSGDGSVFIVWPAGLFSNAKREFVAGPRKGQTEKITNDEAEGYRKQAEAEWGKYIPGTLFSEPRFLPGKKRRSLPLIEYRFGIPYEAGWIDEDGVHRHPVPKAATT